MPSDPDIRWKQRFQGFEGAYKLLREALQLGPSALSALEKEGVIQRFRLFSRACMEGAEGLPGSEREHHLTGHASPGD